MANGDSSDAERFEVEVTFSVTDFDEQLYVMKFHGREELSALFSYNLELACREVDLDFSRIVGQPALLTITREGEARHVHGLVSQVQQQRRGRTFCHYDVTFEPRAFRLKNREDCRVFQKLSMKKIVTQVLQQHRVEHRFRCRGNQDPAEREYCVQYRESDWNFVCRLLEEEGYFFFFEHTSTGHCMVISNDKMVHEEIPGQSTLPLEAPDTASTLRERIIRMSYAEQVMPGQVALQDYNFLKPQVDLATAHESGQGEAELEVYDYPGVYDTPEKGHALSQVRQEANEVKRRGGEGISDCTRLLPGFTFTLKRHHQSALNDRQYLLTGVTHHGATVMNLDEGRVSRVCKYENAFTYIPAEVPFRPDRQAHRPRVMGSQTALVVGPEDQEIHTNELGQVKVQFHWDRLNQRDEHSSCWVRVAQPWAGEGFGFVFTPRIGHEVVVDFLEGDPDRPLITGSVYHVQNPPPLDLPAQQTRSTIRSRSTPGGKGFNEIRLEDQARAEEIYTHAQRNQTEVVRANHSTSVGHDQTRTVKNDRRATIQEGDDHVTVEEGDRTTTIHGQASLEVKTGNRVVKVLEGNYSTNTHVGSIFQNAQKRAHIWGREKGVDVLGKGLGVTITGLDGTGVDISGTGSVGVNVEGRPKVKLKGREAVLIQVGSANKVEITGGDITISSGTVHVTGNTKVELAGGGSTAKLKGDGVELSGPVIKLNT